MWKTKIEYLIELSLKGEFLKISLHFIDKIYKGYVRAINGDSASMTAKMGDEQRLRMGSVQFTPHSAISFVECGL